MSGGGYAITNNEGRLDQLILGNDVLKQRIAYVRSYRAELIRQGKLRPEEANPSLGDIEQTHIIFVHGNFKSYASTNFEYYRANPQGGSSSLKTNATTPVDFQIPQYGDFIGDVVAHVVLNFPTYTETDAVTSGTPDWLIRACDYPGLRLLQNVSLSVNSNDLDTYDSEISVFTNQFMVPPHKRDAFDRCVGQEAKHLVPQTSWGMVSMNSITDTTATVLPRMWGTFTNGAQTPRNALVAASSSIEMFIPLNLFHSDIRLALPAVCLPSNQRYFRLVLASTQQMFGFAPSAATMATTNHPAANMQGAVISTLELFINNIFVHDEVHEIFIDRVGFNLIRIHKAQDFNLSVASDQPQLSQFKFPTETIFIGVRPVTNTGSAAANTEDVFLTRWCKYSGQTDSAVVANASSASLIFRVPSYTRTVDTIGLISQGVDLYKDFPTGLFDSYIPFNYGGVNICAPKAGDGALMATFAFYPGTYQPSGYINISRSQQFYWKYTSTYISSGSASVRSVALNFLVITNGNAYLRYLT
jgi:hypothetical protein